ncbi:MAG: hypothetical protein LUG60_01765 [Erysipelotrichaceae bacterium]|nr:hypothetical protein [Erysipelotrichaceae bacterium]
MGQKISDATFQKGYQLYQNNQVGTIKVNNNLYSANVRDKQYYRVVIMVNDKHKMTKMNCTCIKARKGGTCEHEAAVYLNLKSEFHIFESNEDISFKGYYDNGNYDKAIEFLKSQTNKLIEQLRHDNIKQAFQKLISYIEDYACMDLSLTHSIEIDSIFIKTFRSFLDAKGTSAYYLPWLEEILKKRQLLNIISLICLINNYLPSEELIPVYLECLEDDIDETLFEKIIAYLTKHIKELSQEEQLFVSQQLSQDSIEYQYMMLYQYVNSNKMDDAMKLYEEIHDQLQDFDLKDIEIALYKYKGDVSSYQEYVLEYYKQKNSLDDLSLLKELKNMYGNDWKSAQFVIIDALYEIVGRIDKSILNELSCYEYQAYQYLKNPSKIIPYQLADYMRNNDFQTYLIMQEKKYMSIINDSYFYEYKRICKEMVNEISPQTTPEQFLEFVYDLMSYCRDEDLKEALLEVFEGVTYEYE